MSDKDQRTEKPTKRRLDKARKEGQFAVSREFIGAVQFLGFVWILVTWTESFLLQLRVFARNAFLEAFRVEFDRGTVERAYSHALLHILTPLLSAISILTLVSLAAQLGSTRLGFTLDKFTPDFARINPLKKLREAPVQGLSALKQAILLLPVFGYAVYRIAADNLSTYLALPGAAIEPALRIIANSYKALLWKASFILILLGAIDFMRQYKRHAQTLRMTKQELKDEMKETEGNPQIKMRIRRLQRDAARRNMMKEVPKATAVIVNPTHYSVAIRYEMQSLGAPRVVAKGKNYLARRIREIALDHQIPIVENQPLAQALYKSAQVGQEIPPDLYRAVAEILAYLFKVMNQVRR